MFKNRYFQIKKLQDKVSKAEKECDISKQSYETSIRDLDAYNPKYMEEMTEVILYYVFILMYRFFTACLSFLI